MGQTREERERMVKGVEDFVYLLINDVFNGSDTAPLAVAAILEAGSYDLGPKASRMEDPDQWTEEKYRTRAESISSDKGPKGRF